MELKKNPKVDLKGKGNLRFNIALVLSLSLVITAFEWRFYHERSFVDLGDLDPDFEELIEVPNSLIPPPPPPPVIPEPVIDVVDDDIEIEEKFDFSFENEFEEETALDNYVFEDLTKEKPDEILLFPEVQAEPIGGMQAFYAYISNNLRYPAQAVRMGVEGKVVVEFLIDKDGSIQEVKAVKGIGAGCDEEAERVIREAPKWNPGKQGGKAVKVRMYLPITFKLNR